jgi:hypothetical protein
MRLDSRILVDVHVVAGQPLQSLGGPPKVSRLGRTSKDTREQEKKDIGE